MQLIVTNILLGAIMFGALCWLVEAIATLFRRAPAEAPPANAEDTKRVITPDGTVLYQEHDKFGHPIPRKWFAVEPAAEPEKKKGEPNVVYHGAKTN